MNFIRFNSNIVLFGCIFVAFCFVSLWLVRYSRESLNQKLLDFTSYCIKLYCIQSNHITSKHTQLVWTNCRYNPICDLRENDQAMKWSKNTRHDTIFPMMPMILTILTISTMKSIISILNKFNNNKTTKIIEREISPRIRNQTQITNARSGCCWSFSGIIKTNQQMNKSIIDKLIVISSDEQKNQGNEAVPISQVLYCVCSETDLPHLISERSKISNNQIYVKCFWVLKTKFNDWNLEQKIKKSISKCFDWRE